MIVELAEHIRRESVIDDYIFDEICNTLDTRDRRITNTSVTVRRADRT